MQFFQAINKERLYFALNKWQKSVPQSQSRPLTFPHIKAQAHLHLSPHVLFSPRSRGLSRWGRAGCISRTLAFGLWPPSHLSTSPTAYLIARAIMGFIMHAALPSLLRRKLVWCPERQLNSRKRLNKIKDKENIYIYIHIIKSAVRKVIKKQLTKLTLWLVLLGSPGRVLWFLRSGLIKRCLFLGFGWDGRRKSEIHRHVWAHKHFKRFGS